jgi:DNA-binding transcriptional LysR family regulator
MPVISVKLHQLRQFVTLAETLNFHRAAEILNIAQPPLSISLRKLENELGAPLFSRENRRVELTAAGLAALPEARRTLFHAEQFRLAVRQSLAGEQGILRLGFVGSATQSLLPRLLQPFAQRFPRVDLTLEESWTTDLLAKLDQGVIDLAIIRVPVFESVPARIDVLEEDRFVVAVPASSPFAERDSVLLEELRDQPFIFYSRTNVPNLRALVMLMCHEAGFDPIIAQETIQAQTMISLVESGLGIALVASVSGHARSGGVRFLKIAEPSPRNRISLALASRPDRQNLIAENFLLLALGLTTRPPETSISK